MDTNTFYNVCYYFAIFFGRLCVSESVIKREKEKEKEENKERIATTAAAAVSPQK